MFFAALSDPLLLLRRQRVSDEMFKLINSIEAELKDLHDEVLGVEAVIDLGVGGLSDH